jgi:aminopeptidase-like protein
VPEKWTCHEAWLETLDGRRLLSAANNPLHVVRYSLPFEGEVDRDVLFRHLHVHPRLPDAVPFVFKYYERDWGLCCTQDLRDSLHDARYRVVIRTSFNYGTLKVGEVVVRGRSDREFVLCAHLCHPAMVNDDLSGVVVGIDVMRALLARPKPRYTYRFLIVPETIGSIAYLSQNPGVVPRMAGGLFLEMLGRDHPHALQLSFTGSTSIDSTLTAVLKRRDSRAWTAPFRALMGNDERQFNAPGVRVPMLSLTRQLPSSHPDFPYREYHSSHDTPSAVSWAGLEESRDLVLHMIDALERTVIPAPRYPGEVFCSRYGLNIDFFADPDAHHALFDVMFQIDGTRSIPDIAAACDASPETVERIVAKLANAGLVDLT